MHWKLFLLMISAVAAV